MADRDPAKDRPRPSVPATPDPPVPPDRGREEPVREPPDAPGSPPSDPTTPPKGDPIPAEPTRLV
jgi:hypothetical protein